MQQHKILDWLHETAKRNLFGGGSWPADEETEQIYWSLHDDHLARKSTDGEIWLLTEFATKIDLPSLAAFIGIDPMYCLAAFGWDQGGEVEFDRLTEQLCSGPEDEGDELVKQYLRGAYVRYCAARGLSPFQPAPAEMMAEPIESEGALEGSPVPGATPPDHLANEPIANQ